MASWHLIPKAPRASLILLTGSVVINCPSYSIACRLRGISGIDPAAGEVLREASTSDIILVAAVATRHMGRCPLKASSVCTQTGRALPPCLAISKTLSTRSRAWQGGGLLLVILMLASTNVAPDLRPGADGAGTVRRSHGHERLWRPVAPCLGRPAGRRGELRAGRPRAGAGPVGHRPDDRGARRGHPPPGWGR